MATELLAWHPTAERMPDNSETVLMWVEDDGVGEWFAGWYDSRPISYGGWIDAASGATVAGAVTHWARPAGPHP